MRIMKIGEAMKKKIPKENLTKDWGTPGKNSQGQTVQLLCRRTVRRVREKTACLIFGEVHLQILKLNKILGKLGQKGRNRKARKVL